ncbi:MAG: pilus assembly protein [Pirellulaceae bacterium]
MNHPIHCTPTRPIRVRRRATRRALSGSLPLRSGVTTVEFAMTAPLLFMLLYAALELGHANMTFNAVEAACYEGARVGIVPGAKASSAKPPQSAS